MAAIGADVYGHVLDHAQHRYVDLAEHFHAFSGIEQRQVLGRGHDHRSCNRHFLRQRQLDVARTRRHVDDQVIEIIPRRLGDQLQQRTRNHGAAPDHGGIVIGQEGHRHHFDAMGLDRHEPFLITNLRPSPFGNAEHHALAGAIDIRIQDAYARTLAGQCQRQVGGGGGFAHAALARCHGDDVLDVGHAGHLGLALVGRDHALDVHLGVGHPLKVTDRRFQHLRPALLEQACGVAELHLYADTPILDFDGTHATGSDRILLEIGVGVLAKHGFDGGAIEGTHGHSRWQTECKTSAYPNPSIVSRCVRGVKYIRQPFIVADHPHFHPSPDK